MKEKPPTEQPNLRVCKRKKFKVDYSMPDNNWADRFRELDREIGERLATATPEEARRIRRDLQVPPTTRVERRDLDPYLLAQTASEAQRRERREQEYQRMVARPTQQAPRPVRHTSDNPFRDWANPADQDAYVSGCLCARCLEQHDRARQVAPNDSLTRRRERAMYEQTQQQTYRTVYEPMPDGSIRARRVEPDWASTASLPYNTAYTSGSGEEERRRDLGYL